MSSQSPAPASDFTGASFPLPCLSLNGLLTEDAAEAQKLLNACTTDGGFYVDLDELSDTGKEALPHPLILMAEDVVSIAKEVFSMPLDDKLSWEMDKWGDLQIGGYKPTGKHSGVCRGRRDGFENFLVPLDEVLNRHKDPVPGHLQWPSPLSTQLDLMEKFETRCQRIALLLLSTLSEALNAPPDTPFPHLHRAGQPSTTSLAMLRYLPSFSRTKDQVGHMAHTDVGSLTFIFTSSAGLEVFRHSTSSWVSVPPRPGSIFVNVGDSLMFMSGNRFTSCLHRVVPGTDPREERYSLAFFQRPELSAKFVDNEGREWKSEDWHRAKYKIFRAKTDEQLSTSLLTGQKGFLGDWQT